MEWDQRARLTLFFRLITKKPIKDLALRTEPIFQALFESIFCYVFKNMNYTEKLAFILCLSLLPISALGIEGYSSPDISSPAKLSYRAFTIYTGQEACNNSPDISSIKLRVSFETITIGDKLQAYGSNDSDPTDLTILAFDSEGNFVPNVPVYVHAYSIGRTEENDPGIIYIDSSINYWEARKSGEFAISVRWLCAEPDSGGVMDTVVLKVVEREDN